MWNCEYSLWKSKIQYLKILQYLHLSFNKWPSLQYKFRVWLVLWKHNNGEGLEGQNWVGKGAQATGMTASLWILSSKADSNTWESFTSSELKLESVHQESPRSDIFRKRPTKPLLKQKHCQKHLTWAKEKKNWTVAQWSKVLFSDESTFCISFGNQGLESGGREERHRIHQVSSLFYLYSTFKNSKHSWPKCWTNKNIKHSTTHRFIP